MQKVILTLLTLAILCPAANAQITNYDISQYWQPNQTFRSLGFTFDNSYSNRTTESSQNVDRNTNADLDIDLGLNDYRLRDVDNVESIIRSGINFNVVVDWRELEDNNRRFNTDLTAFNNIERKWFNDRNFFFGLDTDVFARHNTNRFFFQDEAENYTTTRNQLNTAVPISVGIGQPQTVNDAWNAITILEFLEKQGLLTKSFFTDEEIVAFASEIGLIKVTRNTDPRLELIAETERLLQFLFENNMVKGNDYRFFAHLYDAWTFENFRLRQSGNQFELGVAPNIQFNQFVHSTSDGSSSTLLPVGVNLFAGYTIYRPIKTDWQFDVGARVETGPRTIYDLKNDTESSNTWFSTIILDANIGFYPNRRSFYEIFLRPQTSFVNSDLSDDRFTNLLTGFLYTYYFSPQFTISLSGNYSLAQNTSIFQPFSDRKSLRAVLNYFFW